MACRRDRCYRCGVELLVPSEAQSIRCAVCKAVIRTQPNDHLVQAQEPVHQAKNWLKGFIKTLPNKMDTMATTASGYPIAGAYGYGYGNCNQGIQPLLLPVSAHGRKRAVLCGVSYYGRRHMIEGSVNDVRCMRYFLAARSGFPFESILVLSEEETDPWRIPTKYNIQMALRWLVQGCQSGDSLIFHYSGHGLQMRDLNGDEVDGYDETLCPLDYETEGTILDDEINATIVRPLRCGVKLHSIIDACHSGTVLDLPFVCRMNKEGYYKWEDHRRHTASYKGTSGGLAISFSACKDHQVSHDTSVLSGNATTGVLTFSFIQAVEKELALTYGHLLNAMRSTIQEVQTGKQINGPIASLVRKVFSRLNSPVPQLSSSEKFDIHSKQFVL
ncbi:hypothetical protein NMG60_11032677 [Bertholletia excelsa]